MKFMEILWLVMGLSALAGGIHAFFHHDMGKAVVFLVMVVIAFSVMTLRIRFRKQQEKEKEDEG